MKSICEYQSDFFFSSTPHGTKGKINFIKICTRMVIGTYCIFFYSCLHRFSPNLCSFLFFFSPVVTQQSCLCVLVVPPYNDYRQLMPCRSCILHIIESRGYTSQNQEELMHFLIHSAELISKFLSQAPYHEKHVNPYIFGQALVSQQACLAVGLFGGMPES